jgi:chromosome partitioning protein
MGPAPKGNRPKVIGLGGPKGGIGKTTLTGALAAMAARDGARVAIVDDDPQQSLSLWWNWRDGDNPMLFEDQPSAELINFLAGEGWDYVFIDMRPTGLEHIEAVISVTDFVLIPCKVGAFDLRSVTDLVPLCKKHGKAFAFVFNQVMAGWSEMNDSAADGLSKFGPVIKTPIVLRKSFARAVTVGKSGPEVGDAAARNEIEAVWSYVKKAVAREKVR